MQLVEILKKILNNDIEEESIRYNAKNTAKTYDLEILARKIEELYQGCYK